MATIANKTSPDVNDRVKQIEKTAAAYSGAPIVAKEFQADLERVVKIALCEDLGIPYGSGGPEPAWNDQLLDRDVTSAGIIDKQSTARALMLAKSAGVVAGLEVAKYVFQTVDPDCKFQTLCVDGEQITQAPQPIATIEGNARALLLAERTALNLIQRLSGIATTAHKFAAQAREKGIAIVDTRKTTPGLRTLEKYAVQAGGAANHRYGLFDAILIKDNHIQIAGGVAKAIKLARAAHPNLPIEVETANLNDIDQALAENVEKIMLDNMTPAQVTQAVARIAQSRGDAAHRPLIEVSGGVNADNFASYLIDGVNAISIGALTHSVRSMDISLDIEV